MSDPGSPPTAAPGRPSTRAALVHGDPLRELELAGARVAYLERGAGEPTLLLHGYPQSHLSWRFVIDALAQQVRVIAPDWIGWGRSSRPLELRYDYDSEVARVLELLDALGLERVNLFGHDYGGYLGLGLALRHPRRVARLAILNSRAHRSFPWWARSLFATLGVVGHRPALARLIYGGLPIASLARRGLARELPQRCRDRSVLDEYTAWMSEPEGWRWLARFHSEYTTRVDPSLAAGLPQLRCPCAIIWGERDPWCPPSVAEQLARELPDASLTRIPDAGHFVTEEAPEAVVAALRELLAR